MNSHILPLKLMGVLEASSSERTGPKGQQSWLSVKMSNKLVKLLSGGK